METAGKVIEDETLREAMKESGIGTPATRAAIIERLIQVAYIEREGRALHATEKGVYVVRLLGDHPLTSPELTGDWEHRLELIEKRRTEKPVPGFKGRSGRSFSAKLKLVQGEDGKWRVEFDEAWATAPPGDEGNGGAPAGDGAPAEPVPAATGGQTTGFTKA